MNTSSQVFVASSPPPPSYAFFVGSGDSVVVPPTYKMLFPWSMSVDSSNLAAFGGLTTDDLDDRRTPGEPRLGSPAAVEDLPSDGTPDRGDSGGGGDPAGPAISQDSVPPNGVPDSVPPNGVPDSVPPNGVPDSVPPIPPRLGGGGDHVSTRAVMFHFWYASADHLHLENELELKGPPATPGALTPERPAAGRRWIRRGSSF